MSSFIVYLFGVFVLVGALGYGAHLLGTPIEWIGVGLAVVFGFGLMAGAKKLRGDEKT